MDTRIFILAAFVALGSTQSTPWFDCESLSFKEPPKDQAAEHSSAPFGIWTNGTFVARGAALQVTIKRLHIGGQQTPLKSFVVQARRIGESTPIGTWEVPRNTPAEGHNCAEGTDGPNTLSSKDFQEKEQDIVVVWRAPADLIGSIEFLGTFVAASNKYWLKINSIEVDLDVRAGDAPPSNNKAPSVFTNGDPHQSLKEAELAARFRDKQIQEVKNEDAYSEGDWQRKEEQAKRAHQEVIRKEMEQFERQKAQEERTRQERIRMEMLDKEEYERQAWENEHKGEPPKGDEENNDNIIRIDGDDTDTVDGKSTTSGAAVLTSGVLAVIFTFFVFLRRN